MRSSRDQNTSRSTRKDQVTKDVSDPSGSRHEVSGDEFPACQSCRKKKAKCSRAQPCSQCERASAFPLIAGHGGKNGSNISKDIECVYDDLKIKPGLRLGALESLSQRVAALENMFLGQGLLLQPLLERAASLQASSLPSSMSMDGEMQSGSLSARVDDLKRTFSDTGLPSMSASASGAEPPQMNDSYAKRRRNEDVNMSISDLPPGYVEQDTVESGLPPKDLVDSLVEIYFANIHPWIPILHVKDFRRQMNDPIERSTLNTVFHAIVSLCVRFSHDPRLKSPQTRAHYSKQSRQTVILQSMETFSVVNLQAMVIIAFDTIGSGRGPSAWSIVGSMTRTVEQLQLSVEDDSHDKKEGAAEYLIQRMAFLEPPSTWVEAEERRRVFWNVFLMDRFCSIATGWNTSLTSADVRRRLPAEGALWEAGNPVRTPYFGVADKLPSSSLNESPASNNLRSTVVPEDIKSIGGFAYCIEATESLSLVTKFFLQHAVNVENVQEVQMWLMRFKELDLRLVQWKLFLPAEWREASVLNRDGIMDPNLTLAHITHNTSVILLHQGIAYPSPQWRSCPIILPSSSSAKTCITAAAEVSTIAHQYLLNSTSLTNPQFAFCLFISSRVLHAHSRYYNSPLPKEFETMISALHQISRRWAGPYGQNTENLASRFASRLTKAQNSRPESDRPALDIRQPVYSDEVELAKSTRDGQKEHPAAPEEATFQSPDSISLAFPPLPLSFQYSQDIHPENTLTPLSQYASDQVQYFSTSTESGLFTTSNMGNGGDMSGILGTSFEELSGFFDYPFISYQRISTFAGEPGHGNDEQDSNFVR